MKTQRQLTENPMTQSLQDTIKRLDEEFKEKFGNFVGCVPGSEQYPIYASSILSHIHSRDESIRKATIMEVIEKIGRWVKQNTYIDDSGIHETDSVLVETLSAHLQSYLKDNK